MNIHLLLLLSFFISAQIKAEILHCSENENIICEDFLKSKLSTWDYDDQAELIQIKNACIANNNDHCVKYLTNSLPSYDYNDLSEVLSIANNCKDSKLDCIDFIKNKIPTFEFNELSEVNEVARACRRSDVSCITKYCGNRGIYCRNKKTLLQFALRCEKECSN